MEIPSTGKTDNRPRRADLALDQKCPDRSFICGPKTRTRHGKQAPLVEGLSRLNLWLNPQKLLVEVWSRFRDNSELGANIAKNLKCLVISFK